MEYVQRYYYVILHGITGRPEARATAGGFGTNLRLQTSKLSNHHCRGYIRYQNLAAAVAAAAGDTVGTDTRAGAAEIGRLKNKPKIQTSLSYVRAA